MRRILMSAVVTAAMLGMVSVVQAKGNGNRGSSGHGQRGHGSFQKQGHASFQKHGSSHGFKNYHFSHGKKFSHGHFYQGKNHYHWSYRCYYPRYGCDCYWCPSACCWYYWCAPQSCYYPTSYISSAPPTVNITNTAIANGNSIGGTGGVLPAPPGAGAGAVQPFSMSPAN